jgi:hypothetical protein
MSHGRRLAITEEENFQIWLENNRDRPLSDEVERLQDELKRLEAGRRADLRRLHKADAAWWSLMRKGFLGCLGLVALLLWYMNSYLETRGALQEACAFITRGLSEDAGETLAEDLRAANSICNEKIALDAGLQTSR